MRSKTGSLLYSQISEQQKLVLSKESAEILLADQFGSFTGPAECLEHFQQALANLKVVLEGFMCADSIVTAYIRISNGVESNSKRRFNTFVSSVKNGFLLFLREKGLMNLVVREIDGAKISEFVFWLKAEERKLTDATARRYYGLVKRVLETLKDDGHKLSENLSFPRNPFPDAHKSTKKTKRMDDITFGRVIRACMSEIDVQLNALLSAWAFLESGDEVEPDDTKVGSGRYRSDIRSVWTWIRRNYPSEMILPMMSEIAVEHPDVAGAIRVHGFRNVTRPFYPSPESILPFILLFFIYTSANADPMFALVKSGVDEQEVMGVRRIVLDIYKQRSDTYQRSFATDDTDRFSPEQLLKVVERWTKNIRKFAGSHSEHVFLFVTKERIVRGFLTAIYDGLGSDIVWTAAIGNFSKKYDLPKIQLRVIRTTGLDVTRELHNDDILAVSAVAGTKAGATLEFHYESEPTKLRRAEKLLPVMVAFERWAFLGGKPDTRRTPSDSDVLAATPGWGCLDPFASPIPGEVEGRVCQAMGRCPACALGFLDLHSPYALARAVQLVEELKAARYYLDYARWKAAYQTALTYLIKKWLPAFTSIAVIEAAKKYSLSPIGRVE